MKSQSTLTTSTRRRGLPQPFQFLFNVLALSLCLFLPAAAQSRAPMSGAVSDGKGQPIPGATVAVTNLGSGVERTATTDQAGNFLFTDLTPARYRVSVRQPGFSDFVTEVEVKGQGAEALRITLEPGALRESITVVAARNSRDTLTTPEAVSVVTAQQLQERPPVTAVDILRDLPGTATQSQGFLTRPIIRGLEGNRVLVLIDGERLNNGRVPTSHVGNGVETGLIDASSLESIEVIRGAGSVLYGTDALAGTINFVTGGLRRSDNGWRFGAELSPYFTSNGPGGRYGGAASASNRLFALRLRQTFENFSDYKAGAPAEAGFLLALPTYDLGTQRVAGSGFGANATRADGRLFLGDKVVVRGSFDRLYADDYQYPFSESSRFLFSRRQKYSFGVTATELTPLVAGIQAGVYAQRQNRRDQIFTRTPALFQVTDRLISPKTDGFDAQVNLTPAPRHVLTLGASWYRDFSRDDRVRVQGTNPQAPGGLSLAQAAAAAERLKNDPAYARELRAGTQTRQAPNASFSDLAFFAQEEWNARRWLRVVAGLRVDRYASRAEETASYDLFTFIPAVPQIGLDGLQSLNHQNTALTGTLGLVVAPTEQISFVARVGRSYREPNIYDRYNAGASHDLRPTTRTITVPNPDLIAETGINVDAGVRLRTKRFAGGFTYFNNTYRNFISLGGQPIPGVAPVPGPFGPLTILQRVNANKLRMQGVEGEWEIPLRLGDSFLTPVGNVSYTHGDDLRTGLPVDPFWYPAMPLKLVAGARWNSLTNRYWWEYRARVQTGMDRLPPNSLYLRPGTARLGFTTHDLRGGVNWQREHYSIALTVGIENLGNRFYQELYSLSDTPARGRAAIVGLKFKLF